MQQRPTVAPAQPLPARHLRSTRPARRVWRRRLACAAVLAWLPSPLAAQDRLVRRFGPDSGLPGVPVGALAQDSTGFVWVGNTGGLARYDGVEFRRWAPDVIRSGVLSIAVSRTGGVVALTANGFLYELSAAGAREIELPPRAEPLFYPRAAFDSAGSLWIADQSGVLRRRADGSWSALSAAALAHEQPRWISPDLRGGVLVVTPGGVWRVAPDGRTSRALAMAHVVDVLSVEPDRLLVLTGSRLYEVAGDSTRELADLAAVTTRRAVALAERQGTVWIGYDGALVALRPGATAEVIGQDQGIDPLGPLLVDHEGSLWTGTLAGVLQLPEPDTRVWTERSGVPRVARFVAPSGDVMWVSAWGGTTYVRRSGGAGVARHGPIWNSWDPPCAPGSGRLWIATREGDLIEAHDTSILRVRRGFDAHLHDCAIGADGRVWVSTSAGLRHVDPNSFTMRSVATPFPGARADATLVTRDGLLWVSMHNRVCRTDAHTLTADGQAAWSCSDIAGAILVPRLLELPSGVVWASAHDVGVVRFAGDGWELLRGGEAFATRVLHSMKMSPSGGVWLLGHGVATRVLERPDLDDGWEVLETLSAWHGLPMTGGGDLVEDADGSLWIATSQGVVHVPPSARFARPAAPRVTLVEARAGERELPLHEPAELPYRQNTVELRFAALSYRDPSLLRYQVRLEGDEAWHHVRGAPFFRWVDLRAGRYTAEVRASLDGLQWSAEPARLAFVVLPPWYYEPPALLLFALGALLLGWGLYRTRLAYLLGLERQRTRIAMDLHDELGSALGSIGVLSGVIADDVMPAAERRRMAGAIAGTAEELGSALSDIVWSLQPRPTTLAELASRLADHGARLFPGDEFSAELPHTWPATPLPLPIVRNVLLIGVEALHNASRHAAPDQVVLRLTSHGDEWELTVCDDGRGTAANGAGNPLGGRGITGMRRRAHEIGAVLHIGSPAGGGTSVCLRFTPYPQGRRLARRVRSWLGGMARRTGLA